MEKSSAVLEYQNVNIQMFRSWKKSSAVLENQNVNIQMFRSWKNQVQF